MPSVSRNGFILLEDCEGAIGTTEQFIRKIELNLNDNNSDLDLLLALVSRVTRQRVTVDTLGWCIEGYGVAPLDYPTAL